ncbi:hypothetical protein FOA43_000077 [Brettanomyces nanus]|uniref:Calnexin n=1 Tax=Eeniella nana TaxID=13502 RepID=A0A875RVW0_EENNA|nr:uncharacterized protein FOA43_000077 [Brettanomyces nanus]QPG72776.1 hypothetical protein FOA43_000077 [Brettanomyces nanus]
MKLISAAVAGCVFSSVALAIDHPQFKPYTKTLSEDSFFEQFDLSENKWRVSHAKKDGELSYSGKWEIEESTVNIGFKGDKGLVVKSEAALHAISVPLPKVFDNKDNTLVLQYEVKLQKGLDCGGAYIKLLDANGAPDLEENEFNNETPYQVMFGPDKCGSVNKVHFILRRKNPQSGKYEEKALKVPPMARIVKTSVLYTLIIKPNQDFEIRIDGDVVKAGSLLDPRYFELNPPKEIVDKHDKKPKNWVDEEFIRDPNAVKPENWDEDAPYMIADPSATKPNDWDEDTPVSILDPEASQPSYWDDEEDGEWEAPLIANPECKDHGCGVWNIPKVKNPNFKGKWFPPMVKNPAYKGEWEPRTIVNPKFYDDKTPSNLEPIGALGFELWTVTDSILFDNIYLGHSIEEAEDIGNSTFLPKVELEDQESAASAPKAKYEPENPVETEWEPEPWYSTMFDSVVGKAFVFLNSANSYLLNLMSDPVHTLSNRPGEAVLYSSVLVSFFSMVFAFWSALLYLITGGERNSNTPAAVKSPKTEPKEAVGESSKPTESEKNETTAVKRQ